MTGASPLRPNSRASSVSFNALQGMSALLCCGPVFHPKGLDKDSSLYHWLGNMLSSGEPRVRPCSLVVGVVSTVCVCVYRCRHWVARQCSCCWRTTHTPRCWRGWSTAATTEPTPPVLSSASTPSQTPWLHCTPLALLSAPVLTPPSPLPPRPSYPCDMVTVLHVVLYKTADMEHSTRERATHLLQVLDRRFFASGVEQTGRPELVGCLTAGAFSQSHVALSTELALANPELTLPLFCGECTLLCHTC